MEWTTDNSGAPAKIPGAEADEHIASPFLTDSDIAAPSYQPQNTASATQHSYPFTPAPEFTNSAETTLGQNGGREVLNNWPTAEISNGTDTVLSDAFNSTQGTDFDQTWERPSSHRPMEDIFTSEDGTDYGYSNENSQNSYSTAPEKGVGSDIFYTIRDHIHSTLYQSADLTHTMDNHIAHKSSSSSDTLLKAIITSNPTGGALHQNGTLTYDTSNSGTAFYNTLLPAVLNFSFYDNSTIGTDIYNASSNATIEAEMTSRLSLNYGLPMMIVISVLLLTLVVITAFGNFLVGLALYKFKNLRTVSNYLIGNLALSDFLLAITILPLSAVNEALGHWVFGRYMCYFWLCIDVLYCTASIWNLCMIAFDRFTATLYPLWYREKRSAKQAVIYICLVWSVAIGVCIPPILGWNKISQTYSYDEELHVFQCMLFNNKTYVIYSASGSFFIPFFITTFLYMRIFCVLRTRMKRMRHAQKAQRRAQQCTRPLLEKRDDEPCKPVTTPNTLDVKTTTEIEMTTTTHNSSSPRGGVDTGIGPDTSRETSGHSDDTSKSRSSESGCHSDEEHGNGHGNGEMQGLLEKTAGDTGNTLVPTGGGGAAPLVIYNANHNHLTTVGNHNNGNGNGIVTTDNHNNEQPKVKVIVTVENCNGKSTVNNEAIKTVKTTAMKSGGKDATKSDKTKNKKTSSSNNNNISHFKFINIIKSPKPHRRVSQRQRRQDRETKATIRMAIIIAFFCGFWIGFFTTYLLRGIFGDEAIPIPRELDAIFFWLGYSNSAINPILYTIFNEDFRKAFQKVLGCYRRGRHPGGYSRTRN